MKRKKNSSIGKFSVPIKKPDTYLVFVENIFQLIPKISAKRSRAITIKVLLAAALGYLKKDNLYL